MLHICWSRWLRLTPLILALVVLLWLSIETYFFSCGVRYCPPSHEPQISVAPNSLSDLNGIEICLSVKFVEPIQRLEITGSPQLGEDGPYSVVYDYLRSSRFYGVNETVTYTTHSTPEFMDHIGTVAERWDGPVSVALYVPFTDFCRAIHKMLYLRNCDKDAYREKVTWHIFWLKDSPPPSNWRLVPDETHVDCSMLATDYKHNEDLRRTWRATEKLSYPVNVARNIARTASTTWYVLPSDVELYPSLGMAPQFINFIKRSLKEPVKYAFHSSPSPTDQYYTGTGEEPKVYVVPVFEVQKTVPDTKEELMSQYARNTAVYFHKLVCRHCQNFPGIKDWLHKPGTPGEMHIVSWSYRHTPYQRWEPIFLCRRDHEPLYEEQLSWEGLQDKMSQMYDLCLQGYQFHLLDRAFLVHSAGIKRRSRRQPAYPAWRGPFMKENGRVYDQVAARLEAKHGGKNKCMKH